MAIVVGERIIRIDPPGPGPFERIRRERGAGDLLHAVHTIGVTGDRVDARLALEDDRQGKQELHVAPGLRSRWRWVSVWCLAT